jgi:hypothetical protein
MVVTLERAGLLKVAQVQLHMHPAHGQRVQLGLGAPVQEHPQVAFDVASGQAGVAGKVSRHRQLQDPGAVVRVDGCGRQGVRNGSHASKVRPQPIARARINTSRDVRL